MVSPPFPTGLAIYTSQCANGKILVRVYYRHRTTTSREKHIKSAEARIKPDAETAGS